MPRITCTVLTFSIQSFNLLDMTTRRPLTRATLGLALFGVTGHCVADILCR
jgi:hypothetical protein